MRNASLRNCTPRTEMRKPPALSTSASRPIETPSPRAQFCCSLSARYCARSSAISPLVIGTMPVFESHRDHYIHAAALCAGHCKHAERTSKTPDDISTAKMHVPVYGCACSEWLRTTSQKAWADGRADVELAGGVQRRVRMRRLHLALHLKISESHHVNFSSYHHPHVYRNPTTYVYGMYLPLAGGNRLQLAQRPLPLERHLQGSCNGSRASAMRHWSQTQQNHCMASPGLRRTPALWPALL